MAHSEEPDKLGRTGASRGGRPSGSVNKQTLRQQKLKNSLLKHLEPVAVEAIETQIELMRNENSPPTVRFQSSKFIIEKIGDLINEAYKIEKSVDGDQTDEDEEPTGAVLSFSVISNDKK